LIHIQLLRIFFILFLNITQLLVMFDVQILNDLL